jgi:LEA14-like dessication related protein
LDNEDAVKTLKHRYTKGEISRKEYLQMKEDLKDEEKGTKKSKSSHLGRNIGIVVILFIIALIAIFGYQSAQAEAFRNVQINIASAEIPNLGLTSATLNLQLSMFNPSSIPATLSSITYSIYWNNNIIGTGSISGPISIPSHQSVIEPTTITLSYINSLESAFSQLEGKPFSLSINGDATYGSIFGPITTTFSVPINFNTQSSNNQTTTQTTSIYTTTQPTSDYTTNPTTSVYSTIPTTTISQIGTICIASAGYACYFPILVASTGNLTVGMGQATGTNWTGIDIVFVPQGTPYNSSGLPAVSFYSPHAYYLFTLNSGYYANVTLPVTSRINSGTVINGTIWAKYHASGSSVVQYTIMANGTFRAS